VAGGIAMVIAAFACGRSPTGGRSGGGPPPPAPRITGASLVEGGEGVLTGMGLDALPGTVRVDGESVSVTSRTATELRFRMPPPKACDVDGRAVAVTAGALSYTGSLALAAVRMEPGESRLLAASDLAGTCLQLPARSEDYVLSAVDLSLDGTTATVDTLFTVQVHTAGGGTGQPAKSPAPASAPRWAESAGPRPSGSAAGGLAYSDAPVPFDARYATAAVGDTVRWVDYRAPAAFRAGFCTLPKDSVLTYPVIVAAVSGSGRMVIGIDGRNPHLRQWLAPAQQALLAQVAEIADRYALPAVREVMNPAHRPAAGGGGRWWHIFSAAAGGFTIDAAGNPQAACRWNSEVAATLGPDVPLSDAAQVPAVAAYMIHEYGHQADRVEQIRRFGGMQPVPGWLSEAWAQLVQETAARIASGQPTAARFDRLGSGAPLPDFYQNAWGVRPEASPWRASEPYPRGAYEQGTRILMYLRERWGDALLGTVHPRFYQAVAELGRYDPESMAGLVGLDARGLLDSWSLAEATDDLVDPAAAAAHGLPQIATWVPPGSGGGRAVSRTRDAVIPFAAGHGNYAAWYFPSGLENAGRGVSLTFGGVRAGTGFVVRLTRLR
jgi:hypothetical protein